MTERIRLEVDDDELEAVIARLDEAILKKAELVGGPIRPIAGVPEAAGGTAEDVEITIIRLNSELDDVQAQAEFTEAYIEAMINQATAQMIATEQAATAINRDVLAKLLETELRAKSLSAHVRDLPNIDRATRLILLRIPGIREVLRLIYIVKMEERTLRLGQIASTAKAAEINIAATIAGLTGELAAVEIEAVAVEVSVQSTINRLTAEIQVLETQATAGAASIRGPVTAAITLLIYAFMAIQAVQRQQERVEARLRAMEKDMDQRLISIEEAVRGYGALPERYRATVVPG